MFYELGYFTDDDFQRILLQHSKTFSKEEFDELISNEFAAVYNSGTYDGLDRDYYSIISASVLFPDVLKNLIEKHGFSAIKPYWSFIPNGRYSVEAMDDFKEFDLNLIRQKILKT